MMVSDFEHDLVSKREGSLQGEIIDIKQTSNATSILIDHARIRLSKSEVGYEASKVVVYLTEEVGLALGYQVNLMGEFSPLAKATNPGQFDEYSYYRAQGVTCKMYADILTIKSSKKAVISDALYRAKRKLTNQIQLLLPDAEAGLMNAILFGDKTLLTDEIKELYQENGLTHLMAISGLHVSLLGYGIYRLLRKLTLPKEISLVLPIVILLCYGAIVGFSISATRAIVMFILAMSATFIGRTYDMLSSLSLAALILLLQSPLQLYQAGFLFSFAAVLGICVVYPKLCEAIIKKDSKRKRVKQAFLLSVSTQLTTLPISCYFFYEFSIYSIVINMIVLPLCSFLVFSSFLACLCSLLSVALGQFCVGGTYYLLQFFTFLLKCPERLPYHLILIGKLSMNCMIGYYVTLSMILYLYWKTKNCFYWCFLTLLLLFLRVNLPKGIMINSLDVSQGDGTVIFCDGNVAMIDGGSKDITRLYEYRIKPFFKSMGIRHIHTVFISHTDQDHISGILDCLRSMPVATGSDTRAMKNYQGEITIGQLVVPKLNTYDESFLELIAIAKDKQVEVVYLEAGEVYQLQDMTFTSLHPSMDFVGEDKNSSSMVLLASYQNFDGLFTGDIDAVAEQVIILKYQELLKRNEIEFLKVAHHGSKYSSSMEFLEVVSPQIAVISAGKNNTYGHPHQETLERLKDIGCTVYVTKESGAVSTGRGN
jgi:competence protein ComEC